MSDSRLITEIEEYAERNHRLKGLDRYVFVQLLKIFVDYMNDNGYIFSYVGKSKVGDSDGVRE